METAKIHYVLVIGNKIEEGEKEVSVITEEEFVKITRKGEKGKKKQ